MERDTRDNLDTVKDDVRDGASELKHRAEAGGEKIKRAVEGDSMPLGERIGSHLKEMGHDLQADVDRSSRDVRHGGE